MDINSFDDLIRNIFIILSILFVLHNIYKEKEVITKSDVFVNMAFIPIYLVLLTIEVLTIYKIWGII